MSSRVPHDFTVVALIAAFNEEDIIDQVVSDLIRQRIDVYLIDDGSTDRTAASISRHLGHGLLSIEQRPPGHEFDWTSLLRRKEELARELDANWFLHQDADEFRESPWANLNLREALWHVERHGYNAVEFTVLNFRPTEQSSNAGDVRTAMPFYEPADPWDAVQVKAWRKQPLIDLISVGGHDVLFEGRRIFPIPFLSRHYPIRNQEQGTRKVFSERRPRFSARERERGWHVQYDAFRTGHNFVRRAADLLRFDPSDIRVGLALKHREVARLESELADVAAAAPEVFSDLASRVSAVLSELADTRRDRANVVGHLERRLSDLERELTARSAALRLAESDLAAATRLLDSERDRTRQLQREQLTSADRQAELERTLEAALQAQRRLQEQHAYMQHRLQEYASEADTARGEAQALRRSRSWQITAPFRAAYELVLRPGPVAGPQVPARLHPSSDKWGVDRGVPIDRYYIERFLRAHRHDVRGRVLEVKDAGYARMLDDGKVHRIDVLDVDASNVNATIIADLAHADNLEDSQFDCFILTQTLHIIYDIRSALGHGVRLLKPGGVLLCTIPAVSRVNYEDGGLETGDYWRLTQAAVRRLCEEFLPATSTEIATYGNVAACAAFLYGLAVAEVPAQDLEFSDPWFPLIHCIRAVRQ